MEQHPLPFACTTNAADLLDPATARRFLFKVRFLPMDAGQIAAAFRKSFKAAPPASILPRDVDPGRFRRRCVGPRQSGDERARAVHLPRLGPLIGSEGERPVGDRSMGAEERLALGVSAWDRN
jgi:hypothetical protein